MSQDLDNWLERATCDARTIRGRCGAVLYSDGNCPYSGNHIEDVELPNWTDTVDPADIRMRQIREESAERLLSAIFGLQGRYDSERFDQEILDDRALAQWESEGGSL